MRIALDTNILVYSEGINGPEFGNRALDIIDSLDAHELVLPVQVLSELYSVLRRKGGFPAAAANRVVRKWMNVCSTVPSDAETLLTAIDLVEAHRLAFWDAVVLATTASGDCQILYSEDFQSGFTWRGVTVVNPFAPAG